MAGRERSNAGLEPRMGGGSGGSGDGGDSGGGRGGTVILGLGSNLGDRLRQLERALEYLSGQIKLKRVSSVYETEPVGLPDQPWFLNLVATGATQLRPEALLEFVKRGETELGRRSGKRFGPRPIDIDILAYDELVVCEPHLEIPHPRMHERRFVLEPLAEIVPEWRHPRHAETAMQLLESLEAKAVRLYCPPPALSGTPSV